MAKVQKTYTQEFKREAVRLAQTSGKLIAQVARELGVSDSSIHQWRKELAVEFTRLYGDPNSRATPSRVQQQPAEGSEAAEGDEN